MKNLLSLIFINLFLLIKNPIESFKPENFCLKIKNTECLNFECGAKLCSVDEKSCSNLKRWDILIKVYLKKEIDRKTYNKFNQNIKPCKKNPIENLLNKHGFCKKNNHKIVCEMYTCGRNYCANNKKSCDDLITVETLMNGYNKQYMKQEKVKSFLKSIKDCQHASAQDQGRGIDVFGHVLVSSSSHCSLRRTSYATNTVDTS